MLEDKGASGSHKAYLKFAGLRQRSSQRNPGLEFFCIYILRGVFFNPVVAVFIHGHLRRRGVAVHTVCSCFFSRCCEFYAGKCYETFDISIAQRFDLFAVGSNPDGAFNEVHRLRILIDISQALALSRGNPCALHKTQQSAAHPIIFKDADIGKALGECFD